MSHLRHCFKGHFQWSQPAANPINTFAIVIYNFYSETIDSFLVFVDDEGTKRVKQIIVYWAITGQFIQQKRCRSKFTGSKCDYKDGQHM